jgi:pyrroline-5-carboxylate reductase
VEAWLYTGPTVGVIGAGNMGGALVRGWVRTPAPGPATSAPLETVPPAVKVLVWDKIEEASRRLLVPDRVFAAGSLEGLAAEADAVVVVVKPKDAREVLAALGGLLLPGKVVISAMGGLTLPWLRQVLGPGPELFRIMPNLAVGLGAGTVALTAEVGTSPAAVSAVQILLSPLGLVEEIPEALFDVVTAVSGSGPAFLALAIEGLEDGAVASGLSRGAARELVREAAVETARSLGDYSDSAAALREHLLATGTVDTQALELLDHREVGSAFREAVAAAMQRSRQMGKT